MAESNLEKATFAGGCFWCVEANFEKHDGIKSAISGYTGGAMQNPDYNLVSSGRTSHVEAVQITYDPSKISYPELLDIFWRLIDPTDDGGSFVDRGEHYRSKIFYHTPDQEKAAKASKASLEKSNRFQEPIVTEIIPAKPFYTAEDYHQDYYKKNPLRYKFYRSRSGRDQFIEKHWSDTPQKQNDTESKWQSFKKPSDDDLKKTLTPLQYQVTQKDDTERAFNNAYWDNKEVGIYVDIISGEPLFSSTHKYKSGTGWPSFTQALESNHVVEKEDRKLWMKRTEVRSKYANSHLGHVFPDGPEPTGLRYCINSASLIFIPKNELEKEGYGQYLSLFN